MEHFDAAVLLETSVVQIVRVWCGSPRSAVGDEEWNQVPQIVIPRRGLFVLHRYGESVLSDPTTAVVFGREEEFRVSHPVDGGDECLVLEFKSETHEEAIGSQHGHAGHLSPRTQLGVWIFISGLRRDTADAFAREEDGLLLLGELAGDLTDASHAETRITKTQRDRADKVRTLLTDDLGRRWSLDVIGRAVNCSPYHLARQFRRATGESISHYLLRLRLAAALHRIAEGESDFARLAVDLGFSHHSHFTARFRSVFGYTPLRAREALTSPPIDDLSTILTADLDRSA